MRRSVPSGTSFYPLSLSTTDSEMCGAKSLTCIQRYFVCPGIVNGTGVIISYSSLVSERFSLSLPEAPYGKRRCPRSTAAKPRARSRTAQTGGVSSTYHHRGWQDHPKQSPICHPTPLNETATVDSRFFRSELSHSVPSMSGRWNNGAENGTLAYHALYLNLSRAT